MAVDVADLARRVSDLEKGFKQLREQLRNETDPDYSGMARRLNEHETDIHDLQHRIRGLERP